MNKPVWTNCAEQPAAWPAHRNASQEVLDDVHNILPGLEKTIINQFIKTSRIVPDSVNVGKFLPKNGYICPWTQSAIHTWEESWCDPYDVVDHPWPLTCDVKLYYNAKIGTVNGITNARVDEIHITALSLTDHLVGSATLAVKGSVDGLSLDTSEAFAELTCGEDLHVGLQADVKGERGFRNSAGNDNRHCGALRGARLRPNVRSRESMLLCDVEQRDTPREKRCSVLKLY